jgi:hypothetical protein
MEIRPLSQFFLAQAGILSKPSNGLTQQFSVSQEAWHVALPEQNRAGFTTTYRFSLYLPRLRSLITTSPGNRGQERQEQEKPLTKIQKPMKKTLQGAIIINLMLAVTSAFGHFSTNGLQRVAVSDLPRVGTSWHLVGPSPGHPYPTTGIAAINPTNGAIIWSNGQKKSLEIWLPIRTHVL